MMEPGDHACVIYSTRAELVGTVTVYLADGLRDREQCWYATASADELSDVRAALRAANIDVAASEKGEALRLVSAKDLYLADGTFDPEHMLQRLNELIAAAERKRFSAFRLAAEMSWALDPRAVDDLVIEYEALVGTLFTTSGARGLCFYHRDRMPLNVLDGTLNVHPLAGTDGEPGPNPFYRPRPIADLHAPQPGDVAWKLKQLQRRNR
jgi:two-component system, chemotaxis family, sensor kinase Cph1